MQNVSHITNKGLEILFYAGNSSEANPLPDIPPQETKVEDSYEKSILEMVDRSLKSLSLGDLSAYKCNDNLLEYKHDKLEMPYPNPDLTLLSVAQTTYTQSVLRKEITGGDTQVPSLVNTQVEDDDGWLSKGNFEKTEEELSMIGLTATQETVQSCEDVIFINYYKIDDTNSR